MIRTLGQRRHLLNVWPRPWVDGRIVGAALTVGILSIGSKAVAGAKDLVVAYHFGTSDVLDAFLIASLLPVLLINMFAATFGVAFLPIFVQVRNREGPSAAQRLVSNAMVCGSTIVTMVALLLLVLASEVLFLIAPGFDAEQRGLTRSLFLLLIPTLIIGGWTATWAPLLNAHRRFTLTALVPTVTPALILIPLVFLGSRWGIYTLVAGILVGAVVEAAILSRAVRQRGFSLMPRWHGLDPATRGLLSQGLFLLGASLFATGSVLVDQSMATMLGSGAVSGLSYGSKVVMLIFSVASVTISTVIFPQFSQMLAQRDWIGVRRTFKSYASLTLAVGIPTTLVLVWFSTPIVGILFQRGSFTEADATIVGTVQAFYLLQLPFSVGSLLAVRLLAALGKGQFLTAIAVSKLGLNIVGNYILMQHLGVAGISLATSIVYFVSFWVLLTLALREIRKREWASNGESILSQRGQG